MDFAEAIRSGFQNYVNFDGRARRSAYWFWALFVWVASAVLAIVDAVTGIGFVSALFGLATLLPSIAVAVRRLHDIDRSGWFLLLGFIPLVGVVILIIWACQAGTPGPNRFGPEPTAASGPRR
jgi:uncharacterized membrane protein YhaH (DUF805 family)